MAMKIMMVMKIRTMAIKNEKDGKELEHLRVIKHKFCSITYFIITEFHKYSILPFSIHSLFITFSIQKKHVRSFMAWVIFFVFGHFIRMMKDETQIIN